MKDNELEDNEHILKAQEELNNILLSKIHSDEKYKHKEPGINMEKPTPYKCMGRKMGFSSHVVEYSSQESTKNHTKNYQDSSESSDNNQKKKK